MNVWWGGDYRQEWPAVLHMNSLCKHMGWHPLAASLFCHSQRHTPENLLYSIDSSEEHTDLGSYDMIWYKTKLSS